MRIVHMLHGNVMIGGMEKFCIDLCNELSREHEVMLLADECFKGYIDKKVNYIPLEIKKSRNNIFFLYELYRIIKNFNPDIMHGHKQKSIQILKRLEPFLKIPFVATKHDIKIKKAFHGLDYAITISDIVYDTIKAKNIYKIYNGIPDEEPKKIPMPKDFNIISIGGLKKIKMHHLLIDAMDKLSFPCHLTIVGEGVLRNDFMKRIEQLNLEDKVTLAGLKSNVCDYIYSADLQVVTSKAEGFSLALVEGLFYSPLLISTKVGIAEEVLPSSCLYDIDNLVEKITDVYYNQSDYQKQLKEAKLSHKKYFTIETCAMEHLDTYIKIIIDYKGTE